MQNAKRFNLQGKPGNTFTFMLRHKAYHSDQQKMKLFFLILPFLILGCNTVNTKKKEPQNNDLRLSISISEFDTLHDWSLAWRLLEPIRNSSATFGKEKNINTASVGQQSLQAFYDMNSEVTNGGFIQFFWNGYGESISILKKGLQLVGDSAILKIVSAAETEHIKHQKEFENQKLKNDWEPLYDNLKTFDSLDQVYYKTQQKGIALFEKFIRDHAEQFIVLQ